MIVAMNVFFNVNWNILTLVNFTPMPLLVRVYLKQVCFTLLLALVASGVGAYLHFLWNIGGVLTTLGFFGIMGRLYWMSFIPQTTERMRVLLLMVATLFFGASACAWLKFFLIFGRRPTSKLLLGGAIAYGCMTTENYNYLGGLLFSSLTILICSNFSTTIFGSSMAGFEFELYVSLLLLVVFFVRDSQLMIEEALIGIRAHAAHAFSLFLHVAFITCILVTLFLKNTTPNLAVASLL